MTLFSHLLSAFNLFKSRVKLHGELCIMTVKLVKAEAAKSNLQRKCDKLSDENSDLQRKVDKSPWGELINAKLDYQKLLTEWNKLVNQINAKGGMDFLNGSSNQFSKAEIKILIKLCHPDKHDGSQEANDILLKLLQMRK